jgi:hypothetical protein
MPDETKGLFLEDIADLIVSWIPYSRAKVWKNAFYHPHETFVAEAKTATLMQGIKDITVALILSQIIGFVVYLISLLISYLGIMNSPSRTAYFEPTAFIVAAVFGALITIIFLVAWLVFSAVNFAIAKIAGGSGSFETHAYLYSIIQAGVMLIAGLTLWINIATPSPLLVSPLPLFPILALCGILLAAIVVYSTYLNYRVVEYVHNIAGFKALMASLIPPISFFVLAVVFFAPTPYTTVQFYELIYFNREPISFGEALQSDPYWRGEARPFAVIECIIEPNGKLNVIPQNVEFEERILTLFVAKENTGMFTATFDKKTAFSGGEKKMISMSIPSGCTAGKTYEANLDISYEADGIAKKQENNKEPLKCQCSENP